MKNKFQGRSLLLVIRMTLLITATLITSTACSVYQSDARKFLEKQGLQFAAGTLSLMIAPSCLWIETLPQATAIGPALALEDPQSLSPMWLHQWSEENRHYALIHQYPQSDQACLSEMEEGSDQEPLLFIKETQLHFSISPS